MDERDIYNVVTDTVTGPNVRLKDNLIQGIAILACLLVGAGIGILLAQDWIAGAVVGGAIGLLAGLFGSGAFLMVYRAIMHMRGRHR